MKRAPYFRVIDGWRGPFIRLMAGNHREVMRSSEVYDEKRGALNGVKVVRVAVAVELADALLARAQSPDVDQAAVPWLGRIAALLPDLAEHLGDVPVVQEKG